MMTLKVTRWTLLQRRCVMVQLAVATFSSMLCGCVTLEFPVRNILTTPEEIELGRELVAEIEAKETVLDDAAMQAYVQHIGRRIATVSPRQDVAYTFKVIDNPDTVNAFALPGGFVYVYTGLMKLCTNEAELAAVIAHEIGHVAGHHHGEMLTRVYRAELTRDFILELLGKDTDKNLQLLADVILTGGAMHFSRQNEWEADQLGIHFLFNGGYRPEAMLSFMQKMLEEERRRGGVWLPIFSSHPRTADRLERLNALAMQYPPDQRAARALHPDRYEKEVLRKLK
ncbi:MAG TPA: M48 family metalloprotease [Candidatus Hydrogenedentes bacterium]|nr:M48 family metalloprotease [Candidatus Hydrogenedentota bacterium]HIJ73630.1 M48 family metalloprotease [Candidatus Hydrogenedentota bacterium]